MSNEQPHEFHHIINSDDYTTEIDLAYGKIAKKDIPIVMMEPEYYSYARFGSWFGFIVFGALFLIILVIKESQNKHFQRHISAKYLIEERNKKLIQNGKLYTKYIEILIPKKCFNGYIPTSLFKFYVISKSAISEIQSTWTELHNTDMYIIRFVMPNYMQLQSLIIYFSPTILTANGLDKTINLMDIRLKNQNDDIVWKDVVIIDFTSGDTSIGIITGNYIVLQFNPS